MTHRNKTFKDHKVTEKQVVCCCRLRPSLKPQTTEAANLRGGKSNTELFGHKDKAAHYLELLQFFGF